MYEKDLVTPSVTMSFRPSLLNLCLHQTPVVVSFQAKFIEASFTCHSMTVDKYIQACNNHPNHDIRQALDPLSPAPHPQSFPVPFSVSPLPLPHPWQPLTCFLFLVLPSLECHINRVITSYHINRTGASECGCVMPLRFVLVARVRQCPPFYC